jgi:hypothetical protein
VFGLLREAVIMENSWCKLILRNFTTFKIWVSQVFQGARGVANLQFINPMVVGLRGHEP